MTNEEVYKKAIHLSKEELIDFLIEMNEDNNRQEEIILNYEKETNASVVPIEWTPNQPYNGYRVTYKTISYARNVSGGGD